MPESRVLGLTVGGGTTHRVLTAVLEAAAAAGGARHEVVVGSDGELRLDVDGRTVHLPGRTVAVVLGVPAPGEVGIVEDLLVDRAFPDVPGEATVLGELGDVHVDTVAELHLALAAAALCRAAGIDAESVRQGLAAGSPPA